MALDSASKGNLNTRNPEEAGRLIKNLASCNSAMHTNFKRRESVASLWKEQIDDVRARLDRVYKLLKNHISLKENVEIADARGDSEDRRHVDFIRTFNN